MNGHKILVDTNILLYLINGNKKVSQILQGREVYVSFITELELLSYSELTAKQEMIIQSLLADCKIIGYSEWIKVHTIEIRKNNKMKLPDCMILATAKLLDIPLLTADKRVTKSKVGSILLFEE